jgi:hypothetical protein
MGSHVVILIKQRESRRGEISIERKRDVDQPPFHHQETDVIDETHARCF